MSIVKAPTRPRTTARIVRWATLATVLAAVTVLGYLHQRLGVGKPVGVDALCPFGGLETLGSLLASGTLIRRVALSSVLLLGASVGTAIVFRRAFCGRICPLGYLQEIFGGLGKRLVRTRPAMPAALDRPARYLKYVVLAVILGATWALGDLVIRPYDPWATYQHLTSPEVLTEFGIGLAVLGVSLVGSLVYDRFFCKYACPMGAFLGLISRFSLFKVRRDAGTCIDCTLCDRACPTNVQISSVDVVTSPECIDCGECVAACPVEDTLQVRSAHSRPLSPAWWAVLAPGVFALLVAGATAAGAFEWTMPGLAERMKEAAEEAGVSPSAVPFDTALIKGSTTVTEIAQAAGIPAEVFTRVYGIPASEQSRQLKELKETYGAYPGDVRAFVDLYLRDPDAAGSYVPGSSHDEGEEEH